MIVFIGLLVLMGTHLVCNQKLRVRSSHGPPIKLLVECVVGETGYHPSLRNLSYRFESCMTHHYYSAFLVTCGVQEPREECQNENRLAR